MTKGITIQTKQQPGVERSQKQVQKQH